MDDMVRVTFINYEGERNTLAGLVGQNLLQICHAHQRPDVLDDFYISEAKPCSIVHNERWIEDTFAEGCDSGATHVVVPREWFEKIPKADMREQIVINELDLEVKSKFSRIGTQIVMTKELDGLTVYVPDPTPLDYAWE